MYNIYLYVLYFHFLDNDVVREDELDEDGEIVGDLGDLFDLKEDNDMEEEEVEDLEEEKDLKGNIIEPDPDYEETSFTPPGDTKKKKKKKKYWT